MAETLPAGPKDGVRSGPGKSHKTRHPMKGAASTSSRLVLDLGTVRRPSLSPGFRVDLGLV
jgi:hypothetical protein